MTVKVCLPGERVYLSARVTLARGLKLALVYKQILQDWYSYTVTRVNFTSFADVLRHA